MKIPSEEFIKQFMKFVKDSNSANQYKQLLIMFQRPLMRVKAALLIQSSYRAYRWRTKFNYKKILGLFIKQRASLCIQN